MTKIKELIITNVVAAVPEKYIKDVARNPVKPGSESPGGFPQRRVIYLRCEGL